MIEYTNTTSKLYLDAWENPKFRDENFHDLPFGTLQ